MEDPLRRLPSTWGIDFALPDLRLLFAERASLQLSLIDSKFVQTARELKIHFLRQIVRDVPHYKKLKDLPLSEWPTITRSTLREREDELKATHFSNSWRTAIHTSSGTTGHPVRVTHTAFSEFYWQLQDSVHFRLSTPAPKLSPFHNSFVVSLVPDIRRVRMRCIFLRGMRIFQFSLHNLNWDNFLNILDRYRPQYISLDPNTLRFVTDQIESNVRPKHFPEIIFCSGSRLFSEVRNLAENVLGTRVYQKYSSTEFHQIGFECHYRDGYHFDDLSMIIEVFDSNRDIQLNEGEIGELVITNLRNLAQPLVRYRTGDLGSVTTIPCRCGIRLPRILKLQGKILHHFVNREGEPVDPQFLLDKFIDLPIVRWRVIQHAPERFEFCYLPKPSLGKADEVQTEQEIIDRCSSLLAVLLKTSVHIRPNRLSPDEWPDRAKPVLFERKF